MPLLTPSPEAPGSDRERLPRALAARLLREQPAALLAHGLLTAAVIVFLWGPAPTPLLVGWATALLLALAARALGVAQLVRRPGPPEVAIRRLRLLLAASGVAWGLGAAVLAPDLAGPQWALLLVVLSGLVASASATLQADPPAFRLFLSGTLAPFPVGILATGQAREHVFAVLLVLFFASFVLLLNQRLHRMLLTHLGATFQLEQSEARARREHAFLTALFDGAPVATAVVGTDGRVRAVNPPFEALFGYGPDQAVGRVLHELIVPLADRGHAAELDARVARGEAVVAEVERRHRDGHLVPVRRSARQIEGAGDGSTFVIYQDITESKRAAEALIAARDAAQRAAQSQAAFLANMSHEIRTPMNAILGLSELLLGTELASEQRRQVELVHGAADGLLTILNDVLDFSKIEGAHVALERIPFDLPRLAHSTVQLLAVRAHERGLELLCDISPDVPPLVRGDPGRLRQVLTNLIGNAVKFTHQGEIALTVSVQRRNAGEAVVAFAVRDTGIGIPADKLDTIFEAFSQADVSTTRKYGGTGLGLAISQRIVRLMGGEIGVRSEPGKGSEFRFAVPLVVETPPPAAQRPPLDGLRALVVDDNATNRRIVREMLSAAAIAVDEAEDASTAIAAMRRAHAAGAAYGLVVTDAQMPARDGFALAADVMQSADLADARLLMLTSGGLRGDAQRCSELGIRGYLTKPVSQSDLLDAVAAVLQAAQGPAPTVVTRHSIAEARRSLRLLLAEDNPVNQEVAATMLRKRGHQVDVVNNGREAAEAVVRGRYDLVLMDIQMPEMDGLASTQAIRATPAGKDQRIVALTAHASGVERERCLAVGMNGYLTKPFKAHELFALVESTAGAVAGAAGTEGGMPTAPVDLDAFRTTMREAGAEEAVDGIVAMFAQTAPERVEALVAALEAGDADGIARAAHAFKSAAGTIGARALAQLLAEIEQAARESRVEVALGSLARLRDEVKVILEYLEGASHARPDR
jgi:two-component system, sensor histidine kinase and response regulator